MENPKGGGNCYDENGRYFLDNHEDAVIVHGVVINALDNKPMGHCWIEKTIDQEFPGGQKIPLQNCVDMSNGNDANMPLAIYYHAGRVEDTVKYNIEEFRKKILDTGHWGPWEQLCDR